MDGKWVDNPTSPSEEMNHGNPKLHQSGAETLENVDKTSKNHQDDITANGDNSAGAIKNDYGMYVENLYYDSDKTVELPEDPNEVFIYQTFDQSVEEDDDEDGATVGDTVEDNDEVV